MFEAPTTTPQITPPDGVAVIKHGDVVSWYEEVGPARADQFISTYKVDYRKFRPSYGDGLGRDMIKGRWNFDGSPLRFDIEGNFFDGHHRAHAVRFSGTTQTFLIVAGLPVEAYNTTDTGLARNYGDTLRRRGYQNVTQRSALQKLIYRWETGKSLDDSKRLTNSELDEIMYEHIETINWAVGNAMSVARKVDMPLALVSLSWWVLGRIDSADAKTFLIALAEGENLNRKQPVYRLRERLRNDKEKGHTRNEYMHLIFAAWNAFRSGRELAHIPLPSGYVTREMIAVPK